MPSSVCQLTPFEQSDTGESLSDGTLRSKDFPRGDSDDGDARGFWEWGVVTRHEVWKDGPGQNRSSAPAGPKTAPAGFSNLFFRFGKTPNFLHDPK